ncbi:MAG: hypothetical protein ABW022_19065 [Actinoplanes sp.]
MANRWLTLAITVGLAVTAGCALPSIESGQAGDLVFPYPTEGRPQRVAIDHDDYKASYVGHTADGGQFFLTTPFIPGDRDFVALYLFDSDGRFLEAKIDPFDEKLYESRIKDLEDATFGRIAIEPFEVERFGETFGLIVDEPEAIGDRWWVTVEPGDYMAFAPPWDLGIYDT